jgi:polyhydroxybutyrate depolymerase
MEPSASAAEPDRPAGATSGEDSDVPPFVAKGALRNALRRTLTLRGLRRSYLVQPVSTQGGPFRVVIVLHAGGSTAAQVWRQTSLPTLGAREGFIVVAPNGVNKHWNDGRGAVLGGRTSTADDVGFLRMVIQQVIQLDHGDPKAVFMVGPSNGGFMTQYFACQAADMLHAGANLISDLPADFVQNCHPSKPLPWLSMNSDSDPLIPFQGQGRGVIRNGEEQPALLSADQTFKFWADHARCAPQLSEERIDPAGPKWALKRTRSGCVGGTVSVQYVMHGAGHIVPGLPVRSFLIRRFIGDPTMTLDGGTVIWDFFRSTLGH